MTSYDTALTAQLRHAEIQGFFAVRTKVVQVACY